MGCLWLTTSNGQALVESLESQEVFQLPCTHCKMQESLQLMARSSVRMSEFAAAEIRLLLRKESKLIHYHTMVSACPAPNILFSSAAFCAAFAAFLAFLMSSFLITATVALALGVPTSCIQNVRRAGPFTPGRLQSLLDSIRNPVSSKPCILYRLLYTVQTGCCYWKVFQRHSQL